MTKSKLKATDDFFSNIALNLLSYKRERMPWFSLDFSSRGKNTYIYIYIYIYILFLLSNQVLLLYSLL